MIKDIFSIKGVTITSMAISVMFSTLTLSSFAEDKKASTTPTKTEATKVETKVVQPSAKPAPKKVEKEFDILKPGKVVIENYTVQKGEDLKKIALKKSVSLTKLMEWNNLKTSKIAAGKKIIISKYTVPGNKFDGIIVNVPEQKLYYFYKGALNEVYKVSVGTPGKWQTPVGDYKMILKDKAPIWHVPISIQKEMAAKGKEVKTEVKAGPENPLGNWWMGLNKNGLGIHSTNAPASIGYSVTHGCVRMTPKSAPELFNKVKGNEVVRIIYQPIKINMDDNKNVYLEVFPDVYKMNIKTEDTIKTLLKKYNIDANKIDMKKVQKIAKEKDGVPTLISKT